MVDQDALDLPAVLLRRSRKTSSVTSGESTSGPESPNCGRFFTSSGVVEVDAAHDALVRVTDVLAVAEREHQRCASLPALLRSGVG